MGFFDSIKKAALKAKCATGFHTGDFKSIDGKPQCNMEKDCPDCGKHVTTIKHKFGEENYVSQNSCMKSKSCVYCEEVKTREHHASFKEIDIDDYCKVKERCTRCSHERTGQTKHMWEKNAHNATDTEVEFWCVRCKKSEMRSKKSF